jgi:hypothetical protein
MDGSQNPVRRLSSSWTWLFKVFFPVVSIAVPGYLLLFVPLPSGTYDQSNWIFLVFVILAAFLFFHKPINMKFVALSGDELLVSGYVKTIRVPLRDVERIWSDRTRSSRDIQLLRFETRVPTPFGSQIAFMPKLVFGSADIPDPMVDELTELVKKATGRMPR